MVSFFIGGNRSTQRKPPIYSNSLNVCIKNTTQWAGFEFTTIVVVCTDCTGSDKSNYHAITIPMTSPGLNYMHDDYVPI